MTTNYYMGDGYGSADVERLRETDKAKDRMRVANTILAQLGGNRFLAMTGAHTLIGSGNALSMKLRRNQSRASMLRIELDPALDLYRVLFCRATGNKLVIVDESQGVYAEDLQALFTRVTGFDTRL